MKRAKERTPDLILTSDWHLRESTPECRTDDFWEAQWKKVGFIRELAEHHKCDVIHAGDLFNHWKPSPYLISMSIQHLPSRFKTIYGQHDLPQHNLDLAHKSGVSAIDAARNQELLLPFCHYGQEPNEIPSDTSRENLLWLVTTFRKVLVWHKLIWEKKAPHWSNDPTAKEILEQYSEYDLIVTGDNHASFTVEKEGRLLVNPGAITRQAADQENHRPSVYLWFAEDNSVERVYLPIEKDVISREHIDRKQERDKRIDAFVERLSEEWTADVSFETSLERFFQENDIGKPVQQIVRRAIEE